MFCGECGRSVTVTRPPLRSTLADLLPADVELPPELAMQTEIDLDAAVLDEVVHDEAVHNEAIHNEAIHNEAVHNEAVDNGAADDEAEDEADDSGPEHVAGEEPQFVDETPAAEPQADERPAFEQPARAAQPELTHLDVEETRITSGVALGDRYVLQFSTGESVTVFGTGLLGRNPVAEPGEYFDHFVPIVDPSKSVSKTHLEFGQTAGAFWINDRFSGNGTGYRPPDGVRIRCEPGKRYLVTRGSRVDIGEQFFIVS